MTKNCGLRNQNRVSAIKKENCGEKPDIDKAERARLNAARRNRESRARKKAQRQKVEQELAVYREAAGPRRPAGASKEQLELARLREENKSLLMKAQEMAIALCRAQVSVERLQLCVQ